MARATKKATSSKASKKSTKKSVQKSTAKKASVQAEPVVVPEQAATDKPRLRKRESYKSFRLHKKIRPALPPLSGSWSLIKQSLRLLKQHRVLFGGLTLFYAFLSLVFVRGFASSLDVKEIKTALESLVQGEFAGVTVTASLFGILLGTVGTVGTASGSIYQSLLLIIMSLATIWALRSAVNGQNVRVRDTFYKGLYPLGVFVVVLLIIGAQLLPLVIGGWLYGIVVSGGIAVTFVEKAACLLLFLLLAVLSLYFITSSLFGLFVSTIPEMTPLRALKSARQLVLHRRWQVLARIVALLFALPLLSATVMLPFIILLPAIAEWVFFLLTIFGTIFILTYMYLLYRELLNE